MEIKIRKMKHEDIFNVQKVYKKSFLETYPNSKIGITTDDIEKMTESFLNDEVLENFRKNIFLNKKNVLALVAEDKEKEKIIGVCIGIKKNNFNQLKSIYILKRYQKISIGINF